jgi:hypothetical protein
MQTPGRGPSNWFNYVMVGIGSSFKVYETHLLGDAPEFGDG